LKTVRAGGFELPNENAFDSTLAKYPVVFDTTSHQFQCSYKLSQALGCVDNHSTHVLLRWQLVKHHYCSYQNFECVCGEGAYKRPAAEMRVDAAGKPRGAIPPGRGTRQPGGGRMPDSHSHPSNRLLPRRILLIRQSNSTRKTKRWIQTTMPTSRRELLIRDRQETWMRLEAAAILGQFHLAGRRNAAVWIADAVIDIIKGSID
jgi:hypothetical protein